MVSTRTGRLASTALHLWAQAQQGIALEALRGSGIRFESMDDAGPGRGTRSMVLSAISVRSKDLAPAGRALSRAGFSEEERRGRSMIYSKDGFALSLQSGAEVPTVRTSSAARELIGLMRAGLGWREITGIRTRTFGTAGVSLRVPQGVYGPTEWAEAIASKIAEASRGVAGRPPVIVDVGCGSGVLAIASARAVAGSSVFATDISPRAIRVARRNARRNGVAGVRFATGSLLDPIQDVTARGIDVIVENLPSVWPRGYVSRGWSDPRSAILGTGVDGLGLVRELASQATRALAPGGTLIMPMQLFQWEILEPHLVSIGYPRTGASHPFTPTSVLAWARWNA